MPKCFKCGNKGKYAVDKINIPLISYYVGIKYITLPMSCIKCFNEFRKLLQEWYNTKERV